MDRCDRHSSSGLGSAGGGCPTVHCSVESQVSFKKGCTDDGTRSDHYCFLLSAQNKANWERASSFYRPSNDFRSGGGGEDYEDESSLSGCVPGSNSSRQSSHPRCYRHQREHDEWRRHEQQPPPVGLGLVGCGGGGGGGDQDDAMRADAATASSSSLASGGQHHSNQHLPAASVPLTHLAPHQLQDMARRQQSQIEAQQQMLVAKEQRLKYLRQQDYKHRQMAAEYERLRKLREKVEAQELKLRKLRALRGQNNGQQQQHPSQHPHHAPVATAAVLADLDSIRALFNEKEKELSVAVRKVEDLTHQLEELRSGRLANGYPPQVVELERLRRELAYRKQLHEQQNNMISQQRAQLSMGQEEMMKIDNRIIELQERLARKRMMNQQLASQINAATTAKQAQLRAIQQGMANKNKNKPVSTVEPFQRQQQQQLSSADELEVQNKINKNGAADPPQPQPPIGQQSGGVGAMGAGAGSAADPKYQTLPFGTKFGGPGGGVGAGPGPASGLSKSQKIEQLKQEKENNNVQFASDLPPPPPMTAAGAAGRQQQPQYVDHQGNLNNGSEKPVSSVAPVLNALTGPPRERPTELFPPPQNSSTPTLHPDSPTKARPALPPKPLNSQHPPPYVPAPPPENSLRDLGAAAAAADSGDSSITIRGPQSYVHSSNLSVSAHPEEGTSVDDDMPSPAHSGSDEAGSAADRGHGGYNHNVHVSINRRIQMPPAFLFPEDQTPPSDLIAAGGGGVGGGGAVHDVSDHAAAMYPMMSQIYKEFDHLSMEEKSQLLARTLEEEEYPVPEFESDESDSERKPRPPGIIKKDHFKGDPDSPPSTRKVCFDPLALLLDASLEGELDLVKKTAREVHNPSAANDEGITALHNAICAGHYDIVRFLVLFGCDVNAQDSDGWTPLHCAASCNNLSMVKFLVEHGACIFATTFSDHETAAEKCEEDEEGFAGCSEYLYSVQEKLGVANGGKVFAVYDYKAEVSDELTFSTGDAILVGRKGDDVEKDWWWSAKQQNKEEGYVPKNLLGMFPRVPPGSNIAEDSDTGSSSSSASSSSYTMRDDGAMGEAPENVDDDYKRRSTSSA